MALNKKLPTALIILSYAFIFISIFVLTLLALDVFTIPYLTPFAHLLKTIIAPFVPLIMPLYLGIAIKLYKHTPFPSRKQWLFQAGGVIFQQTPWVLGDLGTLYDWARLGNGMGMLGLGMEAEGLCGLSECKGSWVEAALMVGVVVGESMGWNWDRGYVQKWVDVLAEESMKKELEKKGEVERENMEKGEVVEDSHVVEGFADEKASRS